MTRSEVIFLLGGHDLEMQEIRNILDQYKYRYIDKGLNWDDAKWSSYDEYFNKAEIIVGIELSGKSKKPKRAIDIDHHNERSNELSSIEQIANLLQIKLTRWQKLVAANDNGYIPGLKSEGASEREIIEIRKLDRSAQGVTEEDEQLAEKSILENLTWENNLAIIRSLTNKFSPITDMMYDRTKELIIYNNDSVVYYGEHVNKLIYHYDALIKQDIAYFGGKNNNYFGIKKGVFSKEKIQNEIIDQIKNIVHG